MPPKRKSAATGSSSKAKTNDKGSSTSSISKKQKTKKEEDDEQEHKEDKEGKEEVLDEGSSEGDGDEDEGFEDAGDENDIHLEGHIDDEEMEQFTFEFIDMHEDHYADVGRLMGQLVKNSGCYELSHAIADQTTVGTVIGISVYIHTN